MGELPTPPQLPQSCLHARIRRAIAVDCASGGGAGGFGSFGFRRACTYSHPVCAAAVACLLSPCVVAAQVPRLLALGAPAVQQDERSRKSSSSRSSRAGCRSSSRRERGASIAQHEAELQVER